MNGGETEVGMQITPGVRIYLIGLGVAGAVAIALTAALGWPGWVYAVGGLGIFIGPGSLLINHFKVGWQPAVGPCPHCGERLHYVTRKHFLRCAKCETFLQVVEKQLAPVDPQSSSEKPVFPVPYNHDVTFPDRCMLCGQSSMQMEEIKFENVKDSKGIPGVVSVHTIEKVRLQVPVCAEHAGKKAVALDYGVHPSTMDPESHLSLKFRSLPMLEDFRKHNQAVMPAIANEPSMPHAPAISPDAGP